jgi:hypothetical protein
MPLFRKPGICRWAMLHQAPRLRSLLSYQRLNRQGIFLKAIFFVRYGE